MNSKLTRKINHTEPKKELISLIGMLSVLHWKRVNELLASHPYLQCPSTDFVSQALEIRDSMECQEWDYADFLAVDLLHDCVSNGVKYVDVLNLLLLIIGSGYSSPTSYIKLMNGDVASYCYQDGDATFELRSPRGNP